MEPNKVGPDFNFENVPKGGDGAIEFGIPQSLPELDGQAKHENRFERDQPSPVETVSDPPAVTPAVQADDSSAASNDSSQTTALPVVDTPIIASDDDLIEKEWIEKAKKVIEETKDDPYTRERQISQLQVEYIRKRYGREIGKTGE